MLKLGCVLLLQVAAGTPLPSCTQWLDCTSCINSQCFWGQDKRCVALAVGQRPGLCPLPAPTLPAPNCGQWLDCTSCSNSKCFWGQDKKCVTLDATNNRSVVPCPPPPTDCSVFPACQSCVESHCYWGPDQKCVNLDDSNRGFASPCPLPLPPTPDCTQYNDCKTCGDAHCFWGEDAKCIRMPLGSDVVTCPAVAPVTIKTIPGCKPACKVTQQCVNGKCVAKPTSQPKKGDCLLQEGGKANKKAKKAKNSAVPFIRNGDRYLNPLTCGTLFCHNGTLGLLDCPTLRCPNGNEKQCDPNNKCQPKPCVVTPVNQDCAAANGIPLIKHGAFYRDNQCKTRYCNNGLVTIQDCAVRLCSDNSTKQCDANNNCQPGACPIVAQPVQKGPYGCLAQGPYPALAHGGMWRDTTTCAAYRCDNGTRIQTPCLATLCSNGDIMPCDPANDCQPAACGRDCPASGKFPNLLNNQRYLDAKTCTTYSCDNRVVTSEPCPAAICADGQLQACDPNNRCQPAPCSGKQISPIINITVGIIMLNLTTGLADCPAIGPVPLLHHGGRFMDRSTCTVHTCNNGVLTNEGMCLRQMCPGGLLPGCDPNRACLPKPCPNRG